MRNAGSLTRSTQDKMFYFKQRGDPRPAGCIPLRSVRCHAVQFKGKEFVFEVIAPKISKGANRRRDCKLTTRVCVHSVQHSSDIEARDGDVDEGDRSRLGLQQRVLPVQPRTSSECCVLCAVLVLYPSSYCWANSVTTVTCAFVVRVCRVWFVTARLLARLLLVVCIACLIILLIFNSRVDSR